MEPSPPLISVVIPSYNQPTLLLQTLESVFAQKSASLQVLVVDDGSTEENVKTIEAAVKKWGDRLEMIRQPNAGTAVARNRGITLARGTYVALLDQDDLWPEDRLTWQVTALDSSPDAAMVYGYFEKFGDVIEQDIPAEPAGLRTFADFARRCLLVSPGQALFRRDSLLRIGGLDTTLRGTDDWDLYLRLAGEGQILYENRCALKYRVHGANASKNFWQMYLNGRRVVDKNFPADSSDQALRTAALRFAREYGSYMGINQVIALKRQKRFAAMIWALMKTLWIKPGLLSLSEIGRRARYVIGRTDKAGTA